MVVIKNGKWAVAAVFLVLLAVFVGCGKLEPEQIGSVRHRTTGRVISIGDSREAVEKITGKDVESYAEFTEDNVMRVLYRKQPGLLVDYLDDVVVAIRLDEEGEKWQLASGLHVGMEKVKAQELYEDNTLQEPGLKGGILLSYDVKMNPMPFDAYSPYMIIISFKDNMVSAVTVQREVEVEYDFG